MRNARQTPYPADPDHDSRAVLFLRCPDGAGVASARILRIQGIAQPVQYVARRGRLAQAGVRPWVDLCSVAARSGWQLLTETGSRLSGIIASKSASVLKINIFLAVILYFFTFIFVAAYAKEKESILSLCLFDPKPIIHKGQSDYFRTNDNEMIFIPCGIDRASLVSRKSLDEIVWWVSIRSTNADRFYLSINNDNLDDFCKLFSESIETRSNRKISEELQYNKSNIDKKTGCIAYFEGKRVIAIWEIILDNSLVVVTINTENKYYYTKILEILKETIKFPKENILTVKWGEKSEMESFYKIYVKSDQYAILIIGSIISSLISFLILSFIGKKLGKIKWSKTGSNM